LNRRASPAIDSFDHFSRPARPYGDSQI